MQLEQSGVQRRLIDGQWVQYEERNIPVDELILDSKNPRIQHALSVRLPHGATDAELDALLWERDQVKRLKASIRQGGGVSEPLFVRRTSNGRYIVLEGNQRAVAARHQHAETPNDERFATVPGWIFGDDLNNTQIAVLLAGLHVAGKDRWAPFEQAKHIYELNAVYGKSFDWLATELRLSKSQVMQKVAAYRDFAEFLSEFGGEVSKFSFFEELHKKRIVRDLYRNEIGFRSDFRRWVHEELLVDAKDVRDLPTILESSEARRALETDGIRAARGILMREDPTLGSDLLAAVRDVTRKVNAAPMSEIMNFKGDERKIAIVRELSTALSEFCAIANVTL